MRDGNEYEWKIKLEQGRKEEQRPIFAALNYKIVAKPYRLVIIKKGGENTVPRHSGIKMKNQT